MTRWFDQLPFRLGTTSYIIPDDILPNARYLADKVRDIELVLFDIDEYCNIPDEDQVSELMYISASYGVSYTVHLPLNLNFSEGAMDVSIEKALRVINGTRDLSPLAYVCHLECRSLSPDLPADALSEWQRQREKAVEALTSAAGIAPGKLAVENLESYPIEWNERVIRSRGTSACLDIGHLFLRKVDPVPVMREWLGRTSVVHLHGVGTRDHQSLRHMVADQVRAVVRELIRADYRGVVTLEVFNEQDLFESMEMIRECL